MCGIAGILQLKTHVTDPQRIRRMTRSLQHRGPDGEDTFVDGKMSLGHRRLAIFDLSSDGRQPMSSADGRYTIVHNGEVYNWLEIRQQLNCNEWHSQTDTETILQAFIERGTDCLQMFNGMFAFAIWDSHKQTIFAARDRIGIKPFYYGVTSSEFYFASELKAFFAGGFPKKPNYDLIYDFLRWGLIDHSTQTFFKDIVSLEAAHYLQIDASGSVTKTKYWDLGAIVAEQSTIEMPDAIHQCKNLLEDAIALRMRADVPVGAFLSGGVDSSILASYLAQHSSGKNVECYTYEFDSGGAGEGAFAQEVADWLGLKSNVSTLRSKDVPEYFKKVMYNEEMPITSLRVLSAHKLYEEYRSGSTVILEGHGGDHVGGGFEYYFIAHILDLMERHGKDQAMQVFKNFMQQYGIPEDQHFNKMFNGLASLRRPGSSTQDGTPFIKPICFDDGFLANYTSDRIDFERPFKSHLLNAQFVDMFNHNLPRVLRYADRGSMAVGREARVPILDHRIVELGFRSSDEARVYQGLQRYFMREAAKDMLPDEILNRPKRSIVDPQRRWMQIELHDWVQDTFRSKSFASRGIFNQQKVLNEYERYCGEEQPVTGFHIFQYLNVELWFQMMIDHQDEPFVKESEIYEQV